MKLGIVYTSTTPELIQCVNEEIRKNLGDTPEILNYQDPSILAEVREHGYVTAGAAARLVGMYMQAVSDGVDAILNCCSSVGEVADAAQDIGKYTGIPKYYSYILTAPVHIKQNLKQKKVCEKLLTSTIQSCLKSK